MREGKISIKGIELPVLVASTEADQMRGLMFVDPPFPAMVFPYNEPRINKFWMDNVKAPLDIVFCRDNRVINICRGEAYSTELIGDDHYSDCIIELPAGSVEDFDLNIGDQIPIEI